MRKKLLIVIGIIMIAVIYNNSGYGTYMYCFTNEMNKMHSRSEFPDDKLTYEILHHQMSILNANGAIVIFRDQYKPDVTRITYLIKENGRWRWLGTNSHKVNSPFNYTSRISSRLCSGIIDEEKVVDIRFNNNHAKIIEVGDNVRFWFVEIKEEYGDLYYIYTDGIEKKISILNESFKPN